MNRRWIAFALGAVLCGGAAPPASAIELTVLSFNAWGLGAHTGDSLDRTAAVLRAADADIVGLQETRPWPEDCRVPDCIALGEGRLAELANRLGYHWVEVSSLVPARSAPAAVLSRFPIVDTLADGLGVLIDVEGERLIAWNIHPTDFPYQPYQLTGIGYGDAPFLTSADEAVAAARAARGAALDELLEAVRQAPASRLQLLFGDFNEPSHRDWTSRAARAGRHPLAVPFPLTAGLEGAGFVDAYRQAFPDEMAYPGFTWTPFTGPDDPADHHDRIDYVFLKGEGLVVLDAKLLGEAGPVSDIVVTPWPSDHRAVRVRLEIPPREAREP
jgi:endonuclease/exonuclease/phosphatase family metal-dependent hydrolase